jgi:hypothetical protein
MPTVAVTPESLGRRGIVARTPAFLPAILLFVLHAVAGAVPPDPLHVAGVWDGGDYDSLIQPLVFGLLDASVAEAAIATPCHVARDAAGPSTPPAPTARTPRPPQSRAPPFA